MVAQQENSRKAKDLQGEVEDAIRNKTTDESLLTALSLVIKANVEYAKGVTDLISSDLSNTHALEDIQTDLGDLCKKTEQLIQSQQNLLSAINDSKGYLDSRLRPIYKANGLREDGSEYSPSDRVVISIQNAINNKIVMLIAGGIIFLVTKLALGYWGIGK